VQATVEAGKEEAKRQARRASIALELTEKKKELDEVYARLGEKVLEDDGLRATVGLPEVLEQLARVDEEIRQAEAEAAELRRRLE
jgi:3-methyladenine DNA glycosylase AlkD